ncbi:MAG: transposase, partial [Rhodospirillaceae bacterium]|nr:transposase [Rhodospirillaceae bacterium]
MKDRPSNEVRAQVVDKTDAETLQGFVADHAEAFTTVYTDEAKAYQSLPFHHEAVNILCPSTSRERRTRTAWRASGRCS